MILLIGLLAGLVGGSVRAWSNGRKLFIPELRYLWIVPIAFLPQLIAFQLQATRAVFPQHLAPVALVSSQLLLLWFAWLNRKLPGFALLILGLSLNLLVIALNDGWMPISPETLAKLAPSAPPTALAAGQRMGYSKDWIIRRENTTLWQLSDHLVLPEWLPSQVAFSPGDLLIAIGAFWFFWSLGASQNSTKQS